MMRRTLRADLLLVQNIEALLSARREDAKSLAIWCGHSGSWLSKIKSGERRMAIRDLGKVADFFGLTVSDLFQHGISPLTERRRHPDRRGAERRSPQDRRKSQPGQRGVHPDVRPFPERGEKAG
jgi:hypothetical protein